MRFFTGSGTSVQPTPTPVLDVIDQFPHCDALILHRPGQCEYCDEHPDWQELRELWQINFTGEHEPGKVLCPAEQKRDLRQIEKWCGNTPNADPVIPTQAEISEALNTLQQALTAIERMEDGPERETPDTVGAEGLLT